MTRNLFVYAVVLLCPVVALAQPMADRVPADALIYVGWRGAEAMGPDYDKSHLKGVIDASNLPQLFQELWPNLVARVGQEDVDAAAKVEMVAVIAGALWKHPSAFYFGGVEPGPMPMPRMALICQAGDDAEALTQEIDAMSQEAGPVPIPLQVHHKGAGTVILSLGILPADAEARLTGQGDNPAKPLAEHATFKQALQQVQTDPVAMMYIDIEGIVAMVDGILKAPPDAELPPNSPPMMWPKLRDAFGLGSLKRIVATGGFDGRDWGVRAFVETTEPRTGLARLLDGKPLSADLLDLVPKNAAMMGAAHFDLAALMDEIRSGLGKANPDYQIKYDEMMAMVGQMVGVNLQTDLSRSLGDEWCYYTDANVGGRGLLGLTVINRLRDPAKAEQALTQLARFANAMLQAKLGDEVTIEFRNTEADGLSIHYLAVPGFAPAWTVHEGRLYAAMYPQVIVSAADHAASNRPSIRKNLKLAALMKHLGGQNITSVEYIDLPQMAGDAYTALLAYSRLYAGLADMFGVEMPAMILPPLHKLRPHLSPMAGVAWADGAGWHYRNISPFPGGELVYSMSAGSDMMIGQQAMALGMLLPALGRAREIANRSVCGANMHGIVKAMMIYSISHDERFPPDLGTLVQDGSFGPNSVICPSSGASADSFPIVDLDDDRVRQWINENSSYVYLAGEMDMSCPPDAILLYEKIDNHDGEGINIVFGDSHVQFVQMEEAIKMLRAQGIEAP